MGAVAHRALCCATGALLLLSAGCSGSDDPVVQVSTPPPAPATTSAPGSASTSAPAGSSASAAATKRADTPAPPAGSCGTVTAASGLTLQVLPSPGVSCPGAVSLVRKFQEQLAGRQPAGSRSPASAIVDGWQCVSGPPSSQGGTTCSRQDQTVFAAVAAE